MKKILLHENLKYYRQKYRLTQTQVAEAIEIGKLSYRLYEQCERIPSAILLLRLSKFYNVSCDELLMNNCSDSDGVKAKDSHGQLYRGKFIELTSPTNKPLNERIKLYRRKCGLSQTQVAEVLKVDRSTYALYETGDSIPNAFTVIKLSKLYNIDCNMLLMQDYPNDELELDLDKSITKLTKKEQKMVMYFRMLSKPQRINLLELIKLKGED
ncbi:MAG: transcriptional regulator [Oscillospiraceae bacterium]|nr:transcriptional regulator [Oscillospiraceae bacterium]